MTKLQQDGLEVTALHNHLYVRSRPRLHARNGSWAGDEARHIAA